MKRTNRYFLVAVAAFAGLAARAWAAQVKGLTNESFIQLVAAPNASASPVPAFSASASMSTIGCNALTPSGMYFTGNTVDANDLPTQLSYFENIGAAGAVQLSGACTITDNSSGQSQTFHFTIPIKFTPSSSSNNLPVTAGFISNTLTECAGFTTPSSAASSGAVTAATAYENLTVYPMPNPGSLPAQALPAVAVDIQEFYNGFTIDGWNGGLGGGSPFLIRVLCTPFSEVQSP